MTPLEVSAILFPLFIILVIFRVPVAIALGLACIPVFLLEERLTPFLLMNEMFKVFPAKRQGGRINKRMTKDLIFTP